MPTEVGIRALWRNLRLYLRRVARAEREYEEWLRRNKLSRPTRRWKDIPPPLPPEPCKRPMSELLIEEREQERF